MEAFGNCPNPGPDPRLVGHEEDTCVWCVQLREADAGALPTQAVQGKRSPAPWMVPPGLPSRPAQLDG
ncbi:hypothetical protein GCM10023084_80830 [Streptomyces lacrimifluminis]|uniref:Uncharacterized protein n=1 Tax=Streptomyces lacrimifluminis TaxID=1500077 RepID=A0A917UNP7_9ACTN|nr:hypothetical protein GCM10012282_78980 [Streptomyces lacrimifluminis]